MNIPSVYKRMLIKKILSLQTPESKQKLQEEGISLAFSADNSFTGNRIVGGNLPPKRLKFDVCCMDEQTDDNSTAMRVIETTNSETEGKSATNVMEKQIQQLSEERSCLSLVLIEKKDELGQLKTMPKQPEPLPIPGITMNKFICDNCHHRGHKAIQNKNKKKCPYVKCEGYHYCGLEAKHKEFKTQVTEAEREISKMEKKIKGLDEEILNIRSFLKHNMSSFVTTLKPGLKVANPIKYKGKDGVQNLQRDLRLIKIATEGKIPTDLSRDNLVKLIEKGGAKVSVTCGDFESCDENCDIDKICGESIPMNTEAIKSTAASNIVANTPALPSNLCGAYYNPVYPPNALSHLPSPYLPYPYMTINPTPWTNTQNFNMQNHSNLLYYPYNSATYSPSVRQPSATVTQPPTVTRSEETTEILGEIQSYATTWPPLPQELPPSLPPMPHTED